MANRIMLNETSYHGSGAIQEIATEAKAHGFKKALVCSDPDLIKFGVTAKVTDILDKNGLEYELYSEIKPNPTIDNVKHGVETFKKSGADYLIAIGGGSSMDTSKAIGIIIANPEFEDVRSLEGVAPTKKPCVPIIAVPTTAGEVTINYVITDVERKRKFVCVDPHDMPIIAIVDPESEREKVKDGKYAGEPKGTWSIRSIRYAKSAAVNELLELDQEMKRLNDLVRECIVKPLREHGQEEMLLQNDLEQLLAKLENEVPDFHKWKYGLTDMKPYRSEVDRITSQWLQQVHPEEYREIQKLWNHLQSQQERAYGSSSQKKSYQNNQESDLYKRCGNAILQTLRETEQQKRQWDKKQQTVSKRVRIGHAENNGTRRIR